MNKKKIRDSLRLFGAVVFSWLYIPHLMIYVIGGGEKLDKQRFEPVKGSVRVR